MSHTVRNSVALYRRWLSARSTRASELTLPDGKPLPFTLQPTSVAHAGMTGIDVSVLIHDFLLVNDQARAVRLVCSRSCLNCLCHGDVLRDEFRRIAADVFAAR